ncbi:vitamin K epoxide reductase family protein [Pseudobacteriovorax antillogorgiicola]|uniref:Protein-disulfide isomerase n=1 Tax=Pseudobacteriovorax antillogorgiicola TaxID=1513793 RepID=A0A1Y6C5D7_9BACT|nr:vitamin K epoxide reductase family protein [Pseudobacteriovorax antillogorgiicola]TCS49446.1 protein-disulfide isomerase [Pseudobacteriovorax antillogorgiicola]SMF46501.1 Protein-disulfide isomerase [Pseudobacteriovorax antillogorgiicola]
MAEATPTAPKNNLPILGIILAVIGLAISAYALIHHIEVKQVGQTDAFCNINATFSCDDVANSEYSELFGNPLGLWGIAYFLGLILLLIAAMVKDEYRRDTLPTYALMSGLGIVSSLALFGISYFQVGALCLSCIGVYTVCLIQGLVTFFLRDEIPSSWSLKGLYNGGFYMLIALLGAIGGYQVVEPMPQNNFTPDVPKSAEEVREILKNMKVPQIKVDRSAYSGMGEDYRKGGDDAKVTIVEFADFQCPACQQASQTLHQIYKEFGNQVLVVFKNYPLDGSCNKNIGGNLHEHACKAAVVARCAGRYGKFWPMHDRIFAEQRKIDASRLELWALEMGITKEQLNECLSSKDIIAKIQADIEQATQLNIQGTPAIFINSMPAGNRSYEAIRSQILMHLDL